MLTVPEARHLMAFRLGQTDAFLRLTAPVNEMMADPVAISLGMRLIRRIWVQYQQDRASETSTGLLTSENSLERDRFLALLRMLEPGWVTTEALNRIEAMIIRDKRFSWYQHEISMEDEELLRTIVRDIDTPSNRVRTPDQALEALLKQYAFTTDNPYAQESTAISTCWAVNLATATRPIALGLSATPLPFPGLFRRELFRVDREWEWKQLELVATVTRAAEILTADATDICNGMQALETAFPSRRSNGRICDAFLLLAGITELNTPQLARGLSISATGARKLLDALEAAGLARRHETLPLWSSSVRFRLGEPQLGWLQSVQEMMSVG